MDCLPLPQFSSIFLLSSKPYLKSAYLALVYIYTQLLQGIDHAAEQ